MSNRFFFTGIYIYFIACATTAHAEAIMWTAQSPNNDMNNSTNWSPNIVPGNSDEAIFDSTISGIDATPTETSTPFSISTFNFPNSASLFSFAFDNQTLTFNGAGITGNQTNAAIQITNSDNSSFPGNLLSFLGSTSSSSSSNITNSNRAALTGSHSNIGFGTINSNVYASGPFIIGSGGEIAASNEGTDSTHGTGNNGIANSGSSQLRFDQSFTAENNVTLSIANSGTFSGINTFQGDAVCIINGSQFISSEAFQVGDNFSCEIQNMGHDSSQGVGLSNIGQNNAAQMILQTTGTAGDNCTISISNTGINSSHTTNFSDFVGYLNDRQFFVAGNFQAGEGFSLIANNTGTDTSSGIGTAQVAVINSNSGITGNQILFAQGGTFGNNATISATNNGSYSGTNSNGGSNVAVMNLQQIVFGDSMSPGSYAFNAGDYCTLSASNTGNDSGVGIGADVVGNISTDQLTAYSPCSLGDNSEIAITNSGNYSGEASSSFVSVGSVGGSQLNCISTFQAGDNLTLNVSNSGIQTGSGMGDNFVGDLITGQQANFNDGLIIGNNGYIGISNSGSNSSSTTTFSQVSSLMGYGKQLLVKEQFQTGDHLLMVITNSGVDDSMGEGGNYVGFINNNSGDNTASQLHLDAGGTVGDWASITLSNMGTCQSCSSGEGNVIGVLAGEQFFSVNDFYAGNNFNLTTSNSGTNSGCGKNNNTIGRVGGNGQVVFGNACVLGDNASFVLTNSGTNNDATGTSNVIGVIDGSQMMVAGDFISGINLSMSANNQGTSAGNSSNSVGFVSGSQFSFGQNCTFHDGSTISAFNSGTIASAQIVFAQGFDIASGKATIQAINEGVVGSFGIDIQGSNVGGNAEILLGNSSLYIETLLPTFTIGGLNGDSTSFVQSLPTLVIDTDATTQTEFSGSIQNFPSNVSKLVKTGPGIQKLSGSNTFTGQTTVQEGTLSLNGSLVGDVLINPLGILKGTGTIGGTVTNEGIIAPGESIGTLTILGDYNNNEGNYIVEVDGTSFSDLLLVSETANLNGGVVIASSIDGIFLFNQPYVIVAAGSVNGAYSEASSQAFIKPILTYDHNHVYLTILPDLEKAADSRNQFVVAEQIDSITHPNVLQTLLISDIANLPKYQAQQALESLSGYQYTHDIWTAEIVNRQFIRRLYDPLRPIVSAAPGCLCKPCQECNWTSWLETGGGSTYLRGNREAHGFHMDSYEVTGGFQNTLCSTATIGIASSYEHNFIRYQHGESGQGNTGFIGLYGLYRPASFYALADVAYGYSSTHIKRSIHASSLHGKTTGKPKLSQYTFYGEFGIDYDCSGFLFQPFAAIQTGKGWRTRVKEKSDKGFELDHGLEIKKHRWTLTSARLGVHLTAVNLCQCIDASLDVAWNRLLGERKNCAVGRFIEFGDEFGINGISLDRNGVDYALTLSTCISEYARTYLEINGEIWRHASTYDILAGIEFSW